MDELNKIYVEPTTRCNLTCVTCIRHSWDEPFGDMDWSVYQALIDGLAEFPGAKDDRLRRFRRTLAPSSGFPRWSGLPTSGVCGRR